MFIFIWVNNSPLISNTFIVSTSWFLGATLCQINSVQQQELTVTDYAELGYSRWFDSSNQVIMTALVPLSILLCGIHVDVSLYRGFY